MIGPGKSGLLQRHAEKGSKPYLCTVPGHAAGRHEGVAESHLGRSAGPRSSRCAGPPGPPRQDGTVRRLLMLLAILGAAAPVALFALQDDDGAPAATPQPTHTAQCSSACRRPRSGSVVLARESRELAVALAMRAGHAPASDGDDHRRAGRREWTGSTSSSSRAPRRAAPRTADALAAAVATPTSLPVRAPTRFAVNIAGAGPFRSVAFPLPGRWAPTSGAAFLARATQDVPRTALRPLRRAPLLGSRAHDRHDVEARSAEQARVRDPGRRRWDRDRPHSAGTVRSQVLHGRSRRRRSCRNPSRPWGVAGRERVRAATARLAASRISWLDPGRPGLVHRHLRPRDRTTDRAAHDRGRALHAAALPRFQPRRADRAPTEPAGEVD